MMAAKREKGYKSFEKKKKNKVNEMDPMKLDQLTRN